MAAPIPICPAIPTIIEPQVNPNDHVTPTPSPSAAPLPVYTRPPLFNPVDQTIDKAIIQALQKAVTQNIEEIPQQLATPANVNEHPGKGWMLNFENGKVIYPILIPTNNGRHVLASYYKYDFTLAQPELLLTRGRDQDVYG